MSDQFNYKLVTPEKIYLEGDAQMVVLPGAEGDLGVLPNHSNIITSLRPGIIKVTNSDQTQSLFVEEGFIKFSNNELLVIAVGLDEEAALNNDFINDKIEIGADDKKLIDDLSKKVIDDFISEYEKLSSLSREALEPIIKSLIDKHKTNFKGVGQPLRIALVGSRFGPGIYDVILSLDKAEVVKRLKQI